MAPHQVLTPADADTLDLPEPSDRSNNQDLFVWALYLQGGTDGWVDVEDVYLQCFELAPQRFSWRTKPDLPDYKKCAKALQSVEASTHVGLLMRQGRYLRKLSDAGVQWCERHQALLRSEYGPDKVVRAAASNEGERRLRELRKHPVFGEWVETGVLTERTVDLADALQCSANSDERVWVQRLDEFERLARLTADTHVAEFVAAVRRARGGSKNG